MEQWKVLKRNKNYAVSNLGRVMRVTGGVATRIGRILKFDYDKDGYVKVRLGKYGGRHSVHRLVFETFCGDVTRGLECNHMDGDKTNNKPENLQYITNKENHTHARINGLKCRGEQSHLSKLKKQEVIDILIQRKALGIASRNIAKEYNVTSKTINDIVYGRTWRWLNESSPNL